MYVSQCIEWVATAAENLTSCAPELHPHWNTNDTMTNQACGPDVEMDCFCCFSSPPILIGRSHHSSICLAHLNALNIPRLKRPRPQGQSLSEWLPLLESKNPFLPHLVSLLFHSFSLIFLSLSSVSVFRSMHHHLSLFLSCYRVYVYLQECT